MFTLTAESAISYLVKRGLITQNASRNAVAELLGGGVSNVVVLVHGGDGPLVLKQSLPKLRVEEDWFADRERIYREWAGIDYVNSLSKTASWTTPRVVYEDKSNFLFVMTAAPSDGVNWKEALLGGQVDAAVAARVGKMLAAIHRSSTIVGDGVPVELRQFAELDCFVQLRIDPYHRATAAAHPDLAEVIEREAHRMLPSDHERRALVHGDFSPKNIIVSGVGDEARVLLLDFEVAHLGNPVFDLAFMLNHFTMKAIYNPGLAERYCEAGRSFWSEYLDAVGTAVGDRDALELDTVRQLGALLLARIDGKSPAEYITADEQKEYARRLARDILTGGVVSLSEIHYRLVSQGERAFG